MKRAFILSKTEYTLLSSLLSCIDYVKELNKLLVKANGYGNTDVVFNHEKHNLQTLKKVTLISEDDFNKDFKIEVPNTKTTKVIHKKRQLERVTEDSLKFIKNNFGKSFEVSDFQKIHGEPHISITIDYWTYTLPFQLFREYNEILNARNVVAIYDDFYNTYLTSFLD